MMQTRGGPDMAEQVARLSVPASREWVSLLRTAAASVAARMGYDVEGLEDVRLAVSEVAGAMVAGANSDSVLDCELRPGSNGVLDVRIDSTAARAALPEEDSFAWAVLSAIVDEARIEGSDAGVSVHLRITRPHAVIRESLSVLNSGPLVSALGIMLLNLYRVKGFPL